MVLELAEAVEELVLAAQVELVSVLEDCFSKYYPALVRELERV